MVDVEDLVRALIIYIASVWEIGDRLRPWSRKVEAC